MNKGLVGFICFTLGAGAGVGGAYYILKRRFDDKVEDVRQEFKEEVRGLVKNRVEKKPKNKVEPTKEEVEKYNNIVTSNSYAQKPPINTFSKDNKKKENAHVIKPTELDEYMDEEEYRDVSWTLYSDGTVADSDNKAVDDEGIEKHIGGKENLKYMGKYEDDVMYVVNEEEHICYTVVYDERSYEDMLREEAPQLNRLGR